MSGPFTDNYGRTVTEVTANGHDTYTVNDGVGDIFSISFPTGTALNVVLDAINSIAPPTFTPPASPIPAIVIQPTSGSSWQIADRVQFYGVYNPSSLSSLTITFPANPVDGDNLTLAAFTTITTLTLSPSGGQTILHGISTVPAGGGFATWIWLSQYSVWYRKG